MSRNVANLRVALLNTLCVLLAALALPAQAQPGCTPTPEIEIGDGSATYLPHAQDDTHKDDATGQIVPEPFWSDDGYWLNAFAGNYTFGQWAPITPSMSNVGDSHSGWLYAKVHAFIWSQDAQPVSSGTQEAKAEGKVTWATDCMENDNHVSPPKGWNQWKVINTYKIKASVEADQAESRSAYSKITIKPIGGGLREFSQEIVDNGTTVQTTATGLTLSGGISGELSGGGTAATSAGSGGGAAGIDATARRAIQANAGVTIGVSQSIQTTAATAVRTSPLEKTFTEPTSLVAYCHDNKSSDEAFVSASTSLFVKSMESWGVSGGPVSSIEGRAEGTLDVHITLWKQGVCGTLTTPIPIQKLREEDTPGGGPNPPTGGTTPRFRPAPGSGESIHPPGEEVPGDEKSRIDSRGMGTRGQLNVGGEVLIYAKIRGASTTEPIAFAPANPAALLLGATGQYWSLNPQWGDPEEEVDFSVSGGLSLPKGAWMIRIPCTPLAMGIQGVNFSFGTAIDLENFGVAHIEVLNSAVVPSGWTWGASVDTWPKSRVLRHYSGAGTTVLTFAPAVRGATPSVLVEVAETSGFAWVTAPTLTQTTTNIGTQFQVLYAAPPGAEFTLRLTDSATGTHLLVPVEEVDM